MAANLRSTRGHCENTTMLAMCRELGFDVAPDPTDLAICLVKLAVWHAVAYCDLHSSGISFSAAARSV